LGIGGEFRARAGVATTVKADSIIKSLTSFIDERRKKLLVARNPVI